MSKFSKKRSVKYFTEENAGSRSKNKTLRIFTENFSSSSISRVVTFQA